MSTRNQSTLASLQETGMIDLQSCQTTENVFDAIDSAADGLELVPYKRADFVLWAKLLYLKGKQHGVEEEAGRRVNRIIDRELSVEATNG